MSIFKRNKKNPAPGKGTAKATGNPPDSTKVAGTGRTSAENSPQKVGIVSSVLPSGSDADERTPFSDIVSKRFGPTAKADPSEVSPVIESVTPSRARSGSSAGEETEMPQASRSHLRKVEDLFTSEEPELETDPMANIGRATTITGNIVAEEDLEIHGTIEGSVCLLDHQVTVGSDGLVKASVEANIVLVHGKITGDVTAGDLVEVKPGGIVGGDVKSPRVIMHDGAVIVGGLDMSASLPAASLPQASSTKESSAKSEKETSKKGERPVLKEVELPPMHANPAKADGNAK